MASYKRDKGKGARAKHGTERESTGYITRSENDRTITIQANIVVLVCVLLFVCIESCAPTLFTFQKILPLFTVQPHCRPAHTRHARQPHATNTCPDTRTLERVKLGVWWCCCVVRCVGYLFVFVCVLVSSLVVCVSLLG